MGHRREVCQYRPLWIFRRHRAGARKDGVNLPSAILDYGVHTPQGADKVELGNWPVFRSDEFATREDGRPTAPTLSRRRASQFFGYSLAEVVEALTVITSCGAASRCPAGLTRM